MIIGLTGLPAAGKGTVGTYLKEKYGAKSVRFSDPLRDIIKRVYHDPSRESMSHLATFLRAEFGNDVLIKTLLQDIEASGNGIFVLDGMRYREEYDVLSQRKDFQLWALDTPEDIRYQRIIKRGENAGEKALTKEEFIAQHALPTEQFIPELMSRAHIVIENSGDISTLYKKIDEQLASRVT